MKTTNSVRWRKNPELEEMKRAYVELPKDLHEVAERGKAKRAREKVANKHNYIEWLEARITEVLHRSGTPVAINVTRCIEGQHMDRTDFVHVLSEAGNQLGEQGFEVRWFSKRTKPTTADVGPYTPVTKDTQWMLLVY